MKHNVLSSEADLHFSQFPIPFIKMSIAMAPPHRRMSPTTRHSSPNKIYLSKNNDFNFSPRSLGRRSRALMKESAGPKTH